MTQKKIKSLLAEIFFVCVCLFGCGYSFFQFWTSLNKSLTKNEEEIATISFKYKTAQRKFEDDLLWDRLQQNSPVYDGDTIRTAPLSEATIYFKDGNQMSLYENTLAQIYYKGDSAEINFDGGQIEIQTTNSNLKIKSGNSVIDIEQGTSITAETARPSSQAVTNSTENGKPVDKNKNGLNIQVQNGSVQLTDSVTGEVKTNLQAGQSASMDSTGNIQKKHLSILSPLKDSKYITFANENSPVTFKWDCEQENGALLEIFESKRAETPLQSFTITDSFEQQVDLLPGTHWWRITSGNEYAEGKITITYSQKPQIIAPSTDYIAEYRTKKPAVRLIWSESEKASSYELEIADNEMMTNPILVQRTPQPSSIISTLETGTWYWRVTPYYSTNNIGLANPSETSYFKINKTGELKKPELQLPIQDGLVSTKIPVNGQMTYKSIHFSWKDNPEAVSYDYRLWQNTPNGQPFTSGTTTDNFFSIDTSKLEIKNGTWYWQITTHDVEGNTASSELRKFAAIDSSADQRTLFPPENYRLAASRTQDIRYSWKSNIPYPTTFELASDMDFKDIIHSETTTNTSVAGRELTPGTYFWRISTTVGDMTISTKSKSIYIAPPLDAPEANYPSNNNREVIREGIPLRFEWKPVENADYYQIKLYQKDNPDTPVYERNFIEPSSQNLVTDVLDMWDMDETEYKWTLQAFAEETPNSSRATGYLSTYNFRLKKLKPVRLLLPANGTEFGGIEAIKTPANFVWTSVDEPAKSQLIIFKDGSDESYKFKIIEKPKYSNKMPQLYEGQYFWKIVAYTIDDLDISSKNMNSFTVKKMPILPATKLVKPALNSQINIDYIIDNGLQINFEWEELKQEVARYIFRIYNIHDPSPVFEQAFDPGVKTFTLDGDNFSNTLGKANGEWYWTIEAQTDFMGMLLQHGKEARFDFTVDIPRNKPGDVKTEDESQKVRFGVQNDEDQTENVKKKFKNAKKKDEEKVTITNKKQKKKKKKKK